MTNPEDGKWVTKGAVKEKFREIFDQCCPITEDDLKYVLEDIDKLPAVSIKSPEQIERAIEWFENMSDDDLITYFGSRYSTKHIANMFADFLRCILNQPSTWDEEKIFEETDKERSL